jgi:hypothetical protein
LKFENLKQVLKLAANGQDLGGSLLFERRLGFSGTPSDLLPVEMGRCVFEEGDTAQMLYYLTSPQVIEPFKRNETSRVRDKKSLAPGERETKVSNAADDCSLEWV